MWTGYDEKAVKEICYNCGSDISKRAYAYFRTARHFSPNKIWSEVYDGKAFYFATQAKDHVRLIEIAVHKDVQGKGIGKKVLFRMLSRMKAAGLYKLTFRTPINEEAHRFWLHIGAKIIDMKDNDYEMEINIK